MNPTHQPTLSQNIARALALEPLASDVQSPVDVPTSSEENKTPYIKGPHTKAYLAAERERGLRIIKRVQPTVTQLTSQLDKLREKKGIDASMHGNILQKINITNTGYFEYYPQDVLKDLNETATEAAKVGKPISRQYPMAITTDADGFFIGFEGIKNSRSHVETFIVTPHRAALQVGPFHRSRFLLDNELIARDTQSSKNPPSNHDSPPDLKVYSADFSACIHSNEYATVSPSGHFFRRPHGSIYDDVEPFLSPQSKELEGACGTLGNLWIKGLLENNAEMLSLTLLIDIPGPGKGIFLPPPVCLRYSDSDLYIKIATAMMTGTATVEHKGQQYRITTIRGLRSLEIPVRRASDGKRMETKDLEEICSMWCELHEQEEAWREERKIDGRSHALRSKTIKQTNGETFEVD